MALCAIENCISLSSMLDQVLSGQSGLLQITHTTNLPDADGSEAGLDDSFLYSCFWDTSNSMSYLPTN